ncbi:hypothetical protein BV898_01665 [Hypsibius exemplaris]|uniref:Cysteine synthase 1 n=1 Tax=Hypsibius exemplaris TaxID=2072580 RepID=A0A1W0XAQ1_HYPEX|nr:hypothetical protein BV898_01665 [Hypsibius exemplaris]
MGSHAVVRVAILETSGKIIASFSSQQRAYHSAATTAKASTTAAGFGTTSPRADINTGRWIDSIRNGFAGSVGKTPLIRLNTISKDTGSEILVKAEYANAGGSVKDRAALFLLIDAIERGQLRFDGKEPGTVVEGTAGNTGIGLAHCCLALGLRCVIFMPNNQSQEKVDILRALGAQVFSVPVVPWTDQENYNHQARRYAEKLENAVWTNQFDNVANTRAHYETTGPEIWQQTEGKVDAVVFGTGTGGTIAGVSRYLKERNKNIQVFLADPQGSVLYKWIKEGKLERFEASILCILQTFRLLNEEGFFCGASSGLNVAAAVDVAKLMGPGKTVVSCLCDNGQKYFKRLFSKKALMDAGLLEFVPEKYQLSLR